MDDMISRQIVINAIDTIESEVADGEGFQYEKWREYFHDLPPAQPKIIRCKDCICAHSEVWLTGGGKSEAYAYGYCGKTNLKILPYDFCSKAERRTDEQTD